MIKTKYFLTACLFALIFFSCHAQKLPNVQEKSLHAPVNVKIDGKIQEWDNLIQAKNKATSISYAISNDTDNLYLVVLASDQDIANKIINAGITFTINGSGKSHDDGGIAITFPFLYKEDHRGNLPLLDYNKEVSVWNQQLTAKTKDIRVAGVKGVKDTISIYNQEGIKVAALFGRDSVFAYELAMPLKYLGLSVKNTEPFVYSIKLNGAPNYPTQNYSANAIGPGGVVTPVPLPPREVYDTYVNQFEAFKHLIPKVKKYIHGWTDKWNLMTMYGPGEDLVKSLISPTDFWGEYTLAK